MSTGTPHGTAQETAPLRLDETRVYLAEWLSRREDGPESFDEEQIRQIHRVAGGRMERIERLAVQCMTDPALVQAERPDRRGLVWTALIMAVALPVLVVAVVLPFLAEPHPQPQPASESRVLALPERAVPSMAATPAAESAGEPPVAAGVPSGLRTRDWLLGENVDQYVLQLIGAGEMATIRNFIDHAAVPERELTLLRSRRNGDDWYILVYGLYADAAAAREQRSKLPLYVREINPWPRRLGDVMKESE